MARRWQGWHGGGAEQAGGGTEVARRWRGVGWGGAEVARSSAE